MERNSAAIPSTRPDYSPEQQAAWLQRHAEFVDLARQGEIDVLFLGDSITDGWRTHGFEIWQEHFAPLRAANFGLAGDRTQQVLWRILNGELDGITPKVVVLLIGTNNTTPGLGPDSLTPSNTPAQIAEGILEILKTLQQKLPGAQIILLALFPRGEPSDPLRSDIVDLNHRLAGLAASRGLWFLDLGHEFIAGNGSIPPDIMPDLLHLRAPGYRRWAEHLSPILRPLL